MPKENQFSKVFFILDNRVRKENSKDGSRNTLQSKKILFFFKKNQ